LQQGRIAAATAAGTGNQSANGDQFARDWSLYKSNRSARGVRNAVLARRLVNTSHAYNVPTVLGAVVARECESRCGAIASMLGHRGPGGYGPVEKHHGGITAEIQAAIQRVYCEFANLQRRRISRRSASFFRNDRESHV
jgi:hypothetical protein